MKSSPKIPQVAILVSSTFNWGRQIMQGILAYTSEFGPWHIWVKPDMHDQFDKLADNWNGDGIIARVASNELANDLSDSGLPVVNVSDASIDGFNAPMIRTNDRISVQMAAEHFITRGFRNIAFIGPQFMPNPLWYGKAFEEELALRDLPLSTFPYASKESRDADALAAWLKSLPKPCAILSWGINSARQIITTCLQVGINVPHDIAVLSGHYDDLLSHTVSPALSGILIPTEQIGYQAAKKLHQMMQGENVPADETLIPPLGIRERLSTDTLAVEDPQLVKVVEYIKKHAFESITTNDILNAIPMARRSLDRRFQKAFGRTPPEEIKRIRINKVRQLLADTDLPMQNIAEACGFSTYNYLTHVFKQTTGETPSEYRKKMNSK